jgi:hypothetical protein
VALERVPLTAHGRLRLQRRNALAATAGARAPGLNAVIIVRALTTFAGELRRPSLWLDASYALGGMQVKEDGAFDGRRRSGERRQQGLPMEPLPPAVLTGAQGRARLPPGR